ncbi:MAG: excalibur calcium-binding domain-containing protein [Chloroflexota bacterium]|nr:excalibur calcium-binding domain-containing protein [Chloroflexota bacterium]MDE2961162.1 excalibur calcium-binding domain-containing protein [Chloroflexota bacterium]
MSWDAVPGATHYRIGYVNMVTDYPLAKASVTGDWINAFIYVDENARNIPVANGRAEYTVRRLQQDARHAFTVLTSSNFVDTGAAGSVTSEFSWPSNPRWTFHTVADRGGATAPGPGIDFVSMYPNCDAARAHYPGGVRQGSPIYRPVLDRDGDGVACEPASTVPSGNYLPIQDIGTFSGIGDNTNNVIRLDAGIYRFTTTRQNTDRNVFVDIVELSTGSERSVGIYGRGDSGGSELETIYNDGSSFRLQVGDYILAVDASDSTQDWTVTIELIQAH